MHSSFALIPAFLAAAAFAAPTGDYQSAPVDNCSEAPKSYEHGATPTGHGAAHSKVSHSSVSPTSTLEAIELAAHGTLPDGPLPTKIADTTATIFGVVATQELFESAFFADLIANITADKPGYELKGEIKKDILRDLTAIQAQEQLHALGANGILTTAGHQAIQPCKFTFPVNSFKDAITFISTVTDVVLGTLQEVITTFGSDGDNELTGLIASIVGQEGEQNGFFRSIQHKIPSALPFLTASSGAFAYSALNQVGIVPGSCPNAASIAVPIFKPLTVASNVTADSTSASFSIVGKLDASNSSIVYINQQNTPKTVKISDVKTEGDKTTFTAPFPYKEFEMNGLTIAAVISGSGNFTSAGSVAAKTLFGPGLIEIR